MKHFYIVLSVFLLPVLFFSCLDDTYPEGEMKNIKKVVIAGDSIGKYNANSAELFARIVQENGSKVTAYGFLWSTEPSVQNHTGTEKVKDVPAGNRNEQGVFSILLSDLKHNSIYYAVAYAKNKVGIQYGKELTFTTTKGIGTLSTLVFRDSVNATSALCGAKITNKGEGDLQSLGYYLSTKKEMTANDYSSVANGKEEINKLMQADSFVYRIKGLEANTTYYIRPSVKNNYGEFPSLIDSFTTTSGLPEVGLAVLSKVDYYWADMKSKIISEGDSALIAYGFCWNTTKEPTIEDDTIQCNGNLSDFSGRLKKLIPQTRYVVKAFARNKFGVVYSKTETEVVPLSDKPTIITLEVINTAKDTLVIGGKMLAKGMNKIIKSGVCWSKNPSPRIGSKDSITFEMRSDSTFSGTITGLRGGVKYYFKAFVNDCDDDSKAVYSANEIEYTTPPAFAVKKITGARLFPGSPTSFVINNTGYLLGGDQYAQYSSELLSFNASSTQWESRLPLQDLRRKWQTAISIGNMAYVFGGMESGIDGKLVNDLYKYNSTDNIWSKINVENGPDPICQMAGCAFDNSFYLIGGRRDTLTSEVWRYSPEELSWELQDSLPQAQSAGIAVTINNVLYAGLGLNTITGLQQGTRRLWSMEAETNKWKEETPNLESQIIRAGVAFKNKIYVVDDAGRIWIYDPTVKEWTKKGQLPESCRSYHCMFVLGDLIYIGLGNSSETMVAYNPIWDN